MNELEKIKSAVKSAHLPAFVIDLRYKLDADSSGDPAVWIWVILKDEAANASDFGKITKAIEENIVAALRESGIERWPYVRFRSRSEERELVKAEAA